MHLGQLLTFVHHVLVGHTICKNVTSGSKRCNVGFAGAKSHRGAGIHGVHTQQVRAVTKLVTARSAVVGRRKPTGGGHAGSTQTQYYWPACNGVARSTDKVAQGTVWCSGGKDCDPWKCEHDIRSRCLMVSTALPTRSPCAVLGSRAKAATWATSCHQHRTTLHGHPAGC